MQYTRSIKQRLGTGLLSTAVALCLLLLATVSASANTVRIFDDASVLNRSQVNSAASSLQDPINIYTVVNFRSPSSSFDQAARNKLNGASHDQIVMAINTTSGYQHISIVGGSNVPLSSSQYTAAADAFRNSFNSSGYTGATISALNSLKSSLDSATATRGGGIGGVLSTILCIALLVIIGIAVFSFVRRRGSRAGITPTPPPAYMPPNQPYPPNYDPNYPQNYGPNYPPNYGPNYPQNRGMNPWAAGGLGAAAGGFVGYELGKEQGEHEVRDRGGNYGDNYGGNYNQGGGDNFGGGGGADFGGSQGQGGGDFGGGGGADFGGGGGGDFGGGGGGDFGGGGGGGGGDF